VRRAAFGLAAVAIGALLVAAGGLRTTSMKRPDVASPAMRPRASLAESKAEEPCSTCCKTEDDIFLPGNDLEHHSGVKTADRCCGLCRNHSKCLAWTWVKKSSGEHEAHTCFLKGSAPRPLTRVPALGYVSGATLQTEKEGGPLETQIAAPGQSLYCFSLVQPHGYEKGLIAMQYEERASIFTCDEYAVYSNRRMELAPGVFTGIVNSTLKCDMGGEFGTALNTGIFLAVWAKVIVDGRFLFHDWTVKVDPDAVFLPGRLRHQVKDHPEEERGVYLNNCQFGLHGPIEVFSRNAVKAWALGAGECVKYFTNLCSGTCGWGEDMFIDQCLKRKIGARRDNEYRMLLEDHCAPPEGWDECTDDKIASFHPFKTKKGWKACLRAAHKSSSSAALVSRRLRG